MFDRYDLGFSLKEFTRKRRQGGKEPVRYRITDSTVISKVPLKRLFSHIENKSEITELFSTRLLRVGNQKNMKVVVAYKDRCESNFRNFTILGSNQEEADTKLILHAVYASKSGATNVDIFASDTDVLVLAVRRYPDLCEATRFITRRKVINLKHLFLCLGKDKASSLPGFHAFSGADITGSFSGKGKKRCWLVFNKGEKDILQAFASLGTSLILDDVTIAGLEKYVCKLYEPNTKIERISDLRWLIFKKKQAHSENLHRQKQL